MSSSNAHLWGQSVQFHATAAPMRSHQWGASFDGYDGAPDSSQHHNPIGYGPTRYDALLDLLAHLDDHEPQMLVIPYPAGPHTQFRLSASGIAKLLAKSEKEPT